MVLLVPVVSPSHAQTATEVKPFDRKKFVRDMCYRIEAAAQAQGVPKAFLARLIWKESLFDPNAVSPVGAQGIAQFMPETALLRGLKDPFEPHQSIVASASFLKDLHRQFGNWGLAAAAYNAGPGRVARWLSGESGLPFETQDYVVSITGFEAAEWAKIGFVAPPFRLNEKEDFQASCNKFTTRYSLFRQQANGVSSAARKPWGAQVAGHFSRNKALQIFSRLKRQYPSVLGSQSPQVVRKVNRGFGNRPRYNVQIGANSRGEAQQFCQRLKNAGGSCLVLKN